MRLAIPPLVCRYARPAIALVALVAGLSFAPPVIADDALPVPRFVSLKAEEANLRTGPGIRYPVRWVYWKKWLPVEIIEEYDHWRKIRDAEGESGWIHKSLLSGRRTILIKEDIASLHQRPSKETPDRKSVV